MTADSPLLARRDEHVVRVGEHQVALSYDPDGEVWYVSASSLPGLAGQAASREELVDELPLLIRDAALP